MVQRMVEKIILTALVVALVLSLVWGTWGHLSARNYRQKSEKATQALGACGAERDQATAAAESCSIQVGVWESIAADRQRAAKEAQELSLARTYVAQDQAAKIMNSRPASEDDAEAARIRVREWLER